MEKCNFGKYWNIQNYAKYALCISPLFQPSLKKRMSYKKRSTHAHTPLGDVKHFPSRHSLWKHLSLSSQSGEDIGGHVGQSPEQGLYWEWKLLCRSNTALVPKGLWWPWAPTPTSLHGTPQPHAYLGTCPWTWTCSAHSPCHKSCSLRAHGENRGPVPSDAKSGRSQTTKDSNQLSQLHEFCS